MTTSRDAALRAYRDDGLLADAVPAPRSGPAYSALVTVLAVVPLLVVLALVDTDDFRWPVGLALTVFVGGGAIAAMAPQTGRFDWAVPAMLRVGEYVLLLRLADLRDCSAAGFALLAAVVYYHYDIVYRVHTTGGPPPRWVRLAMLGWPFRAALVFVLAVADVARTGYLVAAVALGLIALSASVVGWRPALRGEAAQ